MMWALHIHRTVVQASRQLPKSAFDVVWPAIQNLKFDQKPKGYSQITGTQDMYELVASGYKIVYQLIPEKQIVRCLRLESP